MLSALQSGTTLVVDRYSYSGVVFTAAKQLPGLDLNWCKVLMVCFMHGTKEGPRSRIAIWRAPDPYVSICVHTGVNLCISMQVVNENRAKSHSVIHRPATSSSAFEQ